MHMKRLHSVLGTLLTLWLALTSAVLAEEIRSSIEEDIACCDEYCDDCCDGCGAPFWFAGAEVTFLQSDILTGGNAFLNFNNINTAGLDVQLVGARGIEQFNFAPRMWVGRQITDRWAVAGRFWYLNDSVIDPAPSPPGVINQTNFATSNDKYLAELYTVDLEAVRSMSIGRTKLDGSIGARHGSFKADAELTSFGVVFSGAFEQMLLATGSHFHGTGVTSGLTGRRQIGNLPLYLFLGGRGSVMQGSSFAFGRASGTLAVSGNAPLVGAATVTRRTEDATMHIGEFQVGLQWEPHLAYFPANAFLRSAFEYQRWVIDAPPVGGAGFGGTLADFTVNSFARASNGNADLFGYSFAAGLTW
jgi:hypothetical protein